MTTASPTFPPLLTGIETGRDEDPFRAACRAAGAGDAGAGDLYWSPSERRLMTALVLEPEVDAAAALEAAFIVMVAFGDCLGALAPPEVGVTYTWPTGILVNGAKAGEVMVGLPDDNRPDMVPAWIVAGLYLEIGSQDGEPEPGLFLNRTTLWDEGCGDLTRTMLLESYARHAKTWLHRWEADGSRPVRDAWLARFVRPGETVTVMSGGQDRHGAFLGLDDAGNLLAKCGDETVTVNLYDTLRAGSLAANDTD